MSMHVRFRVGGESYAVPVAGVREVADVGELATLPGAPAAVIGLRNFHGQVVPVVDLGSVLATPRSGRPARLLLAEAAEWLGGLAVDAISGVEEISEAAEGVASPYLAGAALLDGTLVGVVDIGAVFEFVAAETHR